MVAPFYRGSVHVIN
jgi:nicotinamidase-related amidase